MEKVIIDVREKDEFDAEHVEGSVHAPLSQWGKHSVNLVKHLSDKPVLLMCRTGRRAGLAADQLKNSASLQCEIYEGGIEKWKKEGGEVVSSYGASIPIMRQVQIAAGFLVTTGVALAVLVNPWFIGLSAFVGAGLVFAGFTGFCAMAILLSKMPWNQKREQA